MTPYDEELLPDGTPAYLAAPQDDLVSLPPPPVARRAPAVSYKPQLGAPTPQGFMPESLVDDAPKASDGSPFPDFNQTSNKSQMLANYLKAKHGGRDFSDEARQAEQEKASGGGGLALLGLGLSTLGDGIRGQNSNAMQDFRDVRKQRYDQTVGEFDKAKAMAGVEDEKQAARDFQLQQLQGLEGFRKAQLGAAERKAVADSVREKFDQDFKNRQLASQDKHYRNQERISEINANKPPSQFMIAGPGGQMMPIEQARYLTTLDENKKRDDETKKRDVERSDKIVESELQAYEKATEDVGAKLAPLSKFAQYAAEEDIPGVGGLNALPFVPEKMKSWFRSTAGKDARNSRQELVDQKIKDMSGAGVPVVEMDRRLATAGLDPNTSDSQAREGFRRDLEQEYQKLVLKEKTLSPEARTLATKKGILKSKLVGDILQQLNTARPSPDGIKTAVKPQASRQLSPAAQAALKKAGVL
jgi:hypothetical protein